MDDESDSGRYRKGDTLAAFKEQLDGRWRKAKFTEPRVATDSRYVIVTVVGGGAAATRSRHEALGYQITDLALGDAGKSGKLANVHGGPFLSTNYMSKEPPVKSFYMIFVKRAKAHRKTGAELAVWWLSCPR
jgi:hypothetical protein